MKRKIAWMLPLLVGMLLTWTATSFAQETAVVENAATAIKAATGEDAEAAPADPEVDPGHTAWMLVCSALVLLMTPGLAFFYGGLVRRKNVLSVLMQCFMCMCMITVLWVVIGYSLAFAGNGGFIGNLDHLFLKGVPFGEDQITVIFQCMFAVITPALILGAFAERIKFGSFCIFSALWLLLVYCPVCHWVWANPDDYEGFFALGNDGALDFAGGTVIHINAGIAALVACLLIGKRQGHGKHTSPPHNLPFAVLGAGLLWVGWFGFNAGSAGASTASAINAFLVTHIAAATAGMVWAIIEWIVNKKPTVLGIISGVVAGLVAITPAAGCVTPMGAIGVGLGGALIAYIGVNMKEKLGYDDTLDVFGIHGLAGIWGALAAGIFASAVVPGNDANGLLAGNPGQVAIQLKAVVYTIVYSGVVSLVLWKLVDIVLGMRSTDHDERVGLDLTEHAETAYTLVD